MAQRCPATGKVMYRTKEYAVTVSRKFSKVAFNVYQCGDCHHWHIGHSRSAYRQAARIDELLRDHADSLKKRGVQ